MCRRTSSTARWSSKTYFGLHQLPLLHFCNTPSSSLLTHQAIEVHALSLMAYIISQVNSKSPSFKSNFYEQLLQCKLLKLFVSASKSNATVINYYQSGQFSAKNELFLNWLSHYCLLKIALLWHYHIKEKVQTRLVFSLSDFLTTSHRPYLLLSKEKPSG